MENFIGDGLSWTILRCSHDDRKLPSASKVALMAEQNAKLAIALTLMEECFLPMVDPRTGINMIPHVLYNLGSPFAHLNYKGFYAVVLEKGDQLIAVASIRIHGTTVAEVPFIATCSNHRRQGMCRHLLSAVEKILIHFKVKKLVLSAIASLVETWTSGFGFKRIEHDEMQKLAHVNLMVFPESVLLVKNLLEESAEASERETPRGGLYEEQAKKSRSLIAQDEVNEYSSETTRIEENTYGDFNILTKDTAADSVHNERKISSWSNEAEH